MINRIVDIANTGVKAINAVIDAANAVPFVNIGKVGEFGYVNFKVGDGKGIFEKVSSSISNSVGKFIA
nr:MAG TPA: hypothetical protein [Caudoviricetes sp.]